MRGHSTRRIATKRCCAGSTIWHVCGLLFILSSNLLVVILVSAGESGSMLLPTAFPSHLLVHGSLGSSYYRFGWDRRRGPGAFFWEHLAGGQRDQGSVVG